MKIVNIFWRECGYPRESFWRTDTAAAGEDARATARRMIADIRKLPGVFGIKAHIAPHPAGTTWLRKKEAA